jgi:Family of unknown function (DUF5522)
VEEGGSKGEGIRLFENEDYYLDRGLMVLTASYLLRRGYCCEQGCRHCPYRDVTNREPDEQSHATIK